MRPHTKRKPTVLKTLIQNQEGILERMVKRFYVGHFSMTEPNLLERYNINDVAPQSKEKPPLKP